MLNPDSTSTHKKEYMREYRRANRAKLRDYKRQYEQEHRQQTRDRQAKYRISHRERLRELSQAHSARNRENIRAKKRLWRTGLTEDQREALREASRQYNQSNKDSRHARYQELREQILLDKKAYISPSRKVGTNGSFSITQLLGKCALHGWRCYLCGTPLSLRTIQPEHRTPLSRGGSNWLSNIAPSCGHCNFSKHTRTESEYRLFKNLSSGRLPAPINSLPN